MVASAWAWIAFPSSFVGATRALGTRTRGSDTASKLRALFLRLEIDSASERSQELLRRELLRTGRLPAGLRSACFDAVSNAEGRWADDLDILGDALERALANRRDLHGRGL